MIKLSEIVENWLKENKWDYKPLAYKSDEWTNRIFTLPGFWAVISMNDDKIYVEPYDVPFPSFDRSVVKIYACDPEFFNKLKDALNIMYQRMVDAFIK